MIAQQLVPGGRSTSVVSVWGESDYPGSESVVGQRLSAQFEEMAELLSKRESLRVLRAYLNEYSDHPNFSIWAAQIDRNIGILSRRLDSAVLRLFYGV